MATRRICVIAFVFHPLSVRGEGGRRKKKKYKMGRLHVNREWTVVYVEKFWLRL
jgi:hypothetical protein